MLLSNVEIGLIVLITYIARRDAEKLIWLSYKSRNMTYKDKKR